MKATGVICELNPMHKGHVHLVKQLKKKDRALVAVLSGPFVQRGSPAVMDKWLRAEIAVKNGFDLVLELPQIYALQDARRFARGAVASLAQLPDIDNLGFAAEEGWGLTEIRRMQRDLENRDDAIRQFIKGGLSLNYALKNLSLSPIPANAKLGLEYARAVEDLGLNWSLEVVERLGAGHTDTGLSSPYPSGSAIRKAYKKQGYPAIADYLAPESPVEYFPDKLPDLSLLNNYLKPALILGPPDLTGSAHFETGMDYRFVKQFSQSGDIEEACRLAANKRQSRSRYRRLFLTGLLGIPRLNETSPLLSYLRPLAFNDRGRLLLKNALGPIVHKPTRFGQDPDRKKILRIDQKAQDLYLWMTGGIYPPEHQRTPFCPS